MSGSLPSSPGRCLGLLKAAENSRITGQFGFSKRAVSFWNPRMQKKPGAAY